MRQYRVFRRSKNSASFFVSAQYWHSCTTIKPSINCSNRSKQAQLDPHGVARLSIAEAFSFEFCEVLRAQRSELSWAEQWIAILKETNPLLLLSPAPFVLGDFAKVAGQRVVQRGVMAFNFASVIANVNGRFHPGGPTAGRLMNKQCRINRRKTLLATPTSKKTIDLSTGQLRKVG